MTSTSFQLDDIYNVLLDMNHDPNQEQGLIIFNNIDEDYIEFQYFWAVFHVWTKVYCINQMPNTLVLKGTSQYLKANFLDVKDFKLLINMVFDAIGYNDDLDMMQPCSWF